MDLELPVLLMNAQSRRNIHREDGCYRARKIKITKEEFLMSTYQICVSGAAKGPTVDLGKDLARETGRQIAIKGHHL